MPVFRTGFSPVSCCLGNDFGYTTPVMDHEILPRSSDWGTYALTDLILVLPRRLLRYADSL